MRHGQTRFRERPDLLTGLAPVTLPYGNALLLSYKRMEPVFDKNEQNLPQYLWNWPLHGCEVKPTRWTLVNRKNLNVGYMVGGEGVEPSVFLMSRSYSPLSSPTGHIRPYFYYFGALGEGRTRTPKHKFLRLACLPIPPQGRAKNRMLRISIIQLDNKNWILITYSYTQSIFCICRRAYNSVIEPVMNFRLSETSPFYTSVCGCFILRILTVNNNSLYGIYFCTVIFIH